MVVATTGSTSATATKPPPFSSHMSKPVSLALVAIGVVLLVLGANASDSFSSEVSEFFSGSPTDKAIWLLIGGMAALIIGGVGLLRGSRA